MVTTVHKPITNKQRFLTSSSPCPICGGYDRMKRGYGERCYGYACDDEYVYCTNDDYAGTLDRHDAGYKHKLHGDCHCGSKHGSTVHHERVKDVKPKKSYTDDKNFFTYDDERATAKYHYRDKDGKIIYTVVRYQWASDDPGKEYEKDFRQFHWEGSEPVPGLVPLEQRVLYNLLALLKANKDLPVYLVEGEKDVEALKQIGLLAVCNVMGAVTGSNSRKWTATYSEALRGRNVTILPDNDPSGEEHAENISKSLNGIAASVSIVRLPDLPQNGDVSDWLGDGGTREQLESIANPTPLEPGVFYSEVEEEEVQWLWKNRIPLGKITILDGLPDQGKSIVSLDLGARVTKGDDMPDGTSGMQGAVIVVAPEDGAGDTIKPRLMASHADVTKVIDLTTIRYRNAQGKIDESPFSIPRDLPLLEEQIIKHKVILVIFDPLMAVLDHGLKAKDDQDVRQAFTPLARMLRRTGCAALVIRHFNKGNSDNAILRGAGSIGIIGAARSGMVVVPDPDDENKHVLATPKHNLADESPDHLLYQIIADSFGRPHIEWQGKTNHTMTDLFSSRLGSTRQEILQILQESDEPLGPRDIVEASTLSYDQARQLLSRMLKDGQISSPARGKYCASQPSQPSQTQQSRPGSGTGIVTDSQKEKSSLSQSSGDGQDRHNYDEASEANLQDCDDCDERDEDFYVTMNNEDRKVIALHATVVRCETRFDSQMSEPHVPGANLTTDAAGNGWCEQCHNQRKLMDLGYAKGWPAVILTAHGGKVKLLAGQDRYFKFARTSGHRLVSAAIANLEAMKNIK